jgi:hypothetical protein
LSLGSLLLSFSQKVQHNGVETFSMTQRSIPFALIVLLGTTFSVASAQEKAVGGVIPKAQKPLKMDGKLTD